MQKLLRKVSVAGKCNICWMGGMWTSEQNWTNVTVGNTNTQLYKSTGFSGKGKSRTKTSNLNQTEE